MEIQKYANEQKQALKKNKKLDNFKTFFIYLTMPIWATILLFALFAILGFLLSLATVLSPLLFYLVYKHYNKPKGKRYAIDYVNGVPKKIKL